MPTALALRPETFGAKIRQARKAAGLSQIELAERVGVTQGHISRIENGLARPDLEQLLAIADAILVDQHKVLDWYAADPVRDSAIGEAFVCRLRTLLSPPVPVAV